MSWSLTISPLPKDEFLVACDHAQASGQDQSLPGVKEDVDAARAALKSLASRVKKSKVAGQASGHTLQPGEEKTHHDGMSVNVFGTD